MPESFSISGALSPSTRHRSCMLHDTQDDEAAGVAAACAEAGNSAG